VAVTARTWVSGEFVTAAKMNTLRDDILELDVVAGFNYAQYGTVTIADGNTSGTATITGVSDRAMVNMNGWSTNANEANYPGATPRLTKTNSTTLTANRGSNNGDTVVAFCVSDPRG
jgi:hypothetical protein